MRRAGLIAATVLAVAIPAAAGARSAPRFSELDLTASGTIVVTWHGDPARGCAAAGMCGYSGSATLDTTGGDGTLILSGSRRIEDTSFDLQSAIVVRVRRAAAGGEAGGTCVDVVPAVE